MKLYTAYTPSHEIFLKEWFLPSMQDDYELIIEKYEQECPSAEYMSEGWTKTMFRRIDLIMRAIEDNWGDVFIFSDVDIQFFQPAKEIISKVIKNHDFAVQKNSFGGRLNAGFFACRANKKTSGLWSAIKKYMQDNLGEHDQHALNVMLKKGRIVSEGSSVYKTYRQILLSLDKRKDRSLTRVTRVSISAWIHFWLMYRSYLLSKAKNDFDIKWRFLPDNFFCPGLVNSGYWEPGQSLPIPQNIIMHHANWSVGVENKIAQLKYVRDTVEARKKTDV